MGWVCDSRVVTLVRVLMQVAAVGGLLSGFGRMVSFGSFQKVDGQRCPGLGARQVEEILP